MEYQTDCYQCGKTFQAKRNTAKFCSAKCRQRANRSHKNGVNMVHEAMTACDAMERMLKGDLDDLYRRDVATGERLSKLLTEMQAMFINYDPL